MKTSFFAIIFFLNLQLVNAQYVLNLGGKLKKDIISTNSERISKGQDITLTNYNIRSTGLDESKNPIYHVSYALVASQKVFEIEQSDIERIEFNQPSNTKDAWDIVSVKAGSFAYILAKGMQFDTRAEMDDECHDYFRQLENGNYLFNDDYLEVYLQSIALGIHSSTLSYGRPGNLAVKILKTSDINAFCMPNGTILITTELLSTINSEEELIGILAHEIAHFELDHQIKNLIAQVERKKRADFWAGMATAFAAAGEGYLAAKSDVYFGGSLTMAASVLSTSIAYQIIDRMGAHYTIEQEKEADEAAAILLVSLGKEKSAYCAVLSRIRNYYFKQGEYAALFASKTHPDITLRINSLGGCNPDVYYNNDFLKKISAVNTFNAIKEFNLLHYVRCNELVEKNIKAQVATEVDYIMKSKALLTLFDTAEKMNEALLYLNKAKSLNVNPYNSVYKEEALVLLRLHKNAEAKQAFNIYLSNLEKSGSDKTQYLENEIEWTKEMIYKVGQL